MTSVPNELLSRLVAENLSSVEFVMDYLQLGFNGRTLTCYVWPKVDLGEGVLSYGDAGYRDALCTFIDEPVVSTVEAAGRGIVVEFSSGTVTMLPDPDELTGPEIAMLDGFDDRSWMVWRPGEDAFAYLA